MYGHAGGIGGGFFTPVAEGEKLKVPGRKVCTRHHRNRVLGVRNSLLSTLSAHACRTSGGRGCTWTTWPRRTCVLRRTVAPLRAKSSTSASRMGHSSRSCCGQPRATPVCDCSQRGVGAVAVCRCQGVCAVGRSYPASWRSGCVSGAGEAEYVPAEGADAFIDANVVVSAVKAATLLGWHPKHTGLVAEVSTSSLEAVRCGHPAHAKRCPLCVGCGRRVGTRPAGYLQGRNQPAPRHSRRRWRRGCRLRQVAATQDLLVVVVAVLVRIVAGVFVC